MTQANDIYPLKDYFNLSDTYFLEKGWFIQLFCFYLVREIKFELRLKY